MAKKIRALIEKEPDTPLNEASMNEESYNDRTVPFKSRTLSRFDSSESVEIGSQDISMTAFSGDGFTQQKIQSTVSLDSTSAQERRVVQQDVQQDMTVSGYQFSELPKRPVSR
ncbi:hypothetical protein N7540_009932 [Penicillium herquei]|nr:hypothetical protein N7540_009932 [Penicillium herquei]